MGTDSIKLFDKALADQILAMEREPLIRFLEANIGILKQRDSLSTVLFEVEQSGSPVPEAVDRLLAEEFTLTGLKEEVVYDFAFRDEEIRLDYWGCYIVFDGDPEGSISCLDFLPDQEEEIFRLLLPKHVDQMISSLYEHIDELSIMGKEDIEKVQKWRDYCAANPDFMVAYMNDF
jgi:hypothetical protein